MGNQSRYSLLIQNAGKDSAYHLKIECTREVLMIMHCILKCRDILNMRTVPVKKGKEQILHANL